MPQRSVASTYTFEQQRTEINLLAADFWSQKTDVDNASSTYLKHNGSNDFTGGTLNVPNAFTISSNSGNGTVTIAGNLQVDGTTTTVNTATMDVVDKNITIAKGSANDAAADGAGITIDSATDITLNFVDANDAWVSSIGLEATTFLKGPYGQFTGSGTPATGQGVEVNAPDANTGQITSYDRDNSAYKELRIKGSSVGIYGGTTNTLAGTFNSTGLTMESGKTIELDDTIVHSGDADTKIRFPAADQISFETGATEYLKLHRYANVNFVEAGSTAHLSLADNGANIRGILIGDGNASSTGGLRLQAGGGSSGFGGGIVMYSHANADNPGGVYIGKSAAATGSIIFGNSGTGNVSAANEFARITSTGNFGIGNDNPTVKLSVDGGTANDATVVQIKNDSTSSYSTTDGGLNTALSLFSDGTQGDQSVGIQFYCQKSGQTGCISEIGATRESNGNSTLVFRTRDSSTGVNERLRITSGGNIKIPGGGYLDFYGSRTTYRHTGSYGEFKNPTGDLYCSVGNDYKFGNGDFSLEYLTIKKDTGYVGIGIDTPDKTGIQNNVKLLQIDGGDGAELILGNSTSQNVSVNHVGAIAFKNIDNSTGSAPHYAGIRSNCTDTSGNMNLKFYAGATRFEADTPDMLIDSVGRIAINETSPIFGQSNGASQFQGGNPKLGLLGSVGIANYSSTTTDYSELAFYRRTKDEPQGDGSHRITSTSNMGRISWYGASNDTAFPGKAYTMECIANGADWWSGANRKGYISFKEGYNDDETMRLTSGRTIDTGSKTISGGDSLAIQNFRVKGIWSGSPSIGKEIELISGYDGDVKMAAIGYNLTDTNKGSTYGGDLVFHTQPLYSSPLALPPERMRISSKGYVLVNTDDGTDEYMMVIKPNLDDDTRPANGLRIVTPNGVGGGVAQTSCSLRVDNDNNWNGCNFQIGADIIVEQQLTAQTTALRVYNKNTYGALYGNHTTVEKNLASITDATSYYSNIITTGSGGTAFHFHGQNGGSDRIKIYQGGDIQNTNNSYGQLSDVKLKENIVDANSQWDDIKAVKVRNFNFTEASGFDTHKQIGVVAQEIETVSPGLVTTDNDITVDESTNEGTITGTTKRVSYSVLYMKAIKALQEAMTRIETLESEVAALKSA